MEDIKIMVTAMNTEDLLIRVTSVFHKRGFKIKSFIFNETEKPDIVEMDITAFGEADKGQVMLNHLTKLYDIKQADLLAC